MRCCLKETQHSRIRTFGSIAVALNNGNKVNKFKAKGENCIMVDYSNEAKAYRLNDEANNRVVKRHCNFSRKQFYRQQCG